MLCTVTKTVAAWKFRIQTPLWTQNPPAHHGASCALLLPQLWKQKPMDQFKLYPKDTKYVRKGHLICWCLPCTVKEQERHQKKKRKCDEGITSPSESQEEPNSVIPIEQFTELLCELACGCEINCCTHISLQGMVEEEDKIFKLIVKHVWEATGFRFTYVWFCLRHKWLITPSVRSASGVKTSRRMVLSNKCMNAAKVKPAVAITSNTAVLSSSLVCIYCFNCNHTNLGCIVAFLTFMAASHWHWWHFTRQRPRWLYTGN